MMYKKIKDTLQVIMQGNERIIHDTRTKTTGRKLTKLLDNWHMMWELQKRAAQTAEEYAFMSAYYNMLTRTILETITAQNGTLDDMVKFIDKFIYLQIKAVEGVIENEN